ncbi:MAG: DUF5615 family PIN-like protein [Nitrospiraceae bacterium]|nr:DUF5615 family PIN-like protein [Nitrospiraceae bacterium]
MVKLYLDEDVHKKVALALRLRGYDVVSAHEVQQFSLSDRQQLEFAITENRAIFTFNAGDFSRLHDECVKTGKIHHGIVVSKQIPLSDTIRRLAQFLFAHSSESIRNQISWI